MTTDNVALALEICSSPMDDIQPAFVERWLTEDFELHYPGQAPIPFSGSWIGRDAFLEFMPTFSRHVETSEMTFGTVMGDGDDVFIRGRTVGRVRATGKSYTSNWLLVWTFRDGKVCRMVEYQDTQAMALAFS